MDSSTRLTILVLILLTGYFALVWLVLWEFLQPFARRLLAGLGFVSGTWSLLNIATKGDQTFWGWFFSDNAELTFGSMYSSCLLMLVALVAVLNALRPAAARWRRVFWLLPVVFFMFMSLDEYYSFHETVNSWRYLYAGSGVLLVTAILILSALERDFKILMFVVLGMGAIGLGGVVLDAFANEVYLSAAGHEIEWFICRRPWHGIECQRFGTVEELLETLGESLVLAGFLSFAQTQQSPARWRITRRALAGLAAGWVLWMSGSLWLVPSIEAAAVGEPVKVEYLDGALTLEAYRLSQDVAAPGDTIDVTLYLRTGKFIHDDYYLSVHLLSQTDVESLAQADFQLGEWDYPTSAWIPYLAVRNTAHLRLPDDLSTPASYWIMVRVWGGPDLTPWIQKPPDYQIVSQEIVITATDRRTLSEDTVVLTALPVLGSAPEADPPTASGYRFDNGMELYGYDLPVNAQAEQSLDIRFWWKTHKNIRADLTQYLHFFEDGGEGFFVFSQQGFGGDFPFSDWPDGVDAVDTWRLTLPGDVPPGTYRVYTGVYYTPTVERIPVKDGSGQPVPDSSILLGTVEIK
jgi:hypothetical protein